MIFKLIVLGVGLTIGNFLWQLLGTKKDWSKAVEISLFQATALICVAILYYMGLLAKC